MKAEQQTMEFAGPARTGAISHGALASLVETLADIVAANDHVTRLEIGDLLRDKLASNNVTEIQIVLDDGITI